MSLEDRIVPLLRKYRVQKHYQGSRAAGMARYAVYAGDAAQLTEPTTHSGASAERDQMTARDIAALIGEEE